MNFDWEIQQEILQFTITMMIGTSIDDRLFKTEFQNIWYVVEATTKTKKKYSKSGKTVRCLCFYVPLLHTSVPL